LLSKKCTGPHQQQCQSDIVEAAGNFVACCFDIVAVFGNKVKRYFDIVAKNGNNVKATFDFVEATFDFVAFNSVASTLLLLWTSL